VASRPKPDANVRTTRTAARGRTQSDARGRSTGTREAVRQIVGRYRETFERLGR
jgi:hypothetical protein